MDANEKINVIKRLLIKRNCPSDCGLKEDCHSYDSCDECYMGTIIDLLREEDK